MPASVPGDTPRLSLPQSVNGEQQRTTQACALLDWLHLKVLEQYLVHQNSRRAVVIIILKSLRVFLALLQVFSWVPLY